MYGSVPCIREQGSHDAPNAEVVARIVVHVGLGVVVARVVVRASKDGLYSDTLAIEVDHILNRVVVTIVAASPGEKHEPSLVLASALKLHASSSVQPGIAGRQN